MFTILLCIMNIFKCSLIQCYILSIYSTAYVAETLSMKELIRRKFLTYNIYCYHINILRYLHSYNEKIISPEAFLYLALCYMPNIYAVAHIVQSSNIIEQTNFRVLMAAQIAITLLLIHPIIQLNGAIYSFASATNSAQTQMNYFSNNGNIVKRKLMALRFAEMTTESENGNFGLSVGPLARVSRLGASQVCVNYNY